MASDQSPLWSSSLQKEALDLIVTIWPELPEAGRLELIGRILTGPPTELGDGKEEHERRQRSSDWLIFERLCVIERLQIPPLPPSGEEMLSVLRLSYPNWQIGEGISAHFMSWMESQGGLETDRNLEEMEALRGARLVEILRKESQYKAGHLLLWSDLVQRRPARGIRTLYDLAAQPELDDADIWRSTLHGLRDAMAQPAVARRVVDVMIRAPDVIASDPRLLITMSDALEAISKLAPLRISADRFLRLWDRAAFACLGLVQVDASTSQDWVGRAINSPLGRLTGALLNLMFGRDLKAGGQLPPEFKERLDQLTGNHPDSLRLARTILASRLLYLFAVDAAWTREHILPRFDWRKSEDEATAMWRAYALGARLTVDLWSELSPFLYEAFTPSRRQRLEEASATLAILLMVAGVEFPATAVPTEQSRRVIRTMDAEERRAAISWLYRYLAGPLDTFESNLPPNAEQALRSDKVWLERVYPWLRRVWPRDAHLVTPETSEQFCLLAIATHDQFPAAVDFVLPYVDSSESWGYVVNVALRNSGHPTSHPKAVLRLLGRIVMPSAVGYGNDLRAVLDRVSAAAPVLCQDPVYRIFDESLRASGG